MIKRRRSALIAIVVFSVGVTPTLVAQNANVAPPPCRDEQGLSYMCELSIPEDILTVGSPGFCLRPVTVLPVICI